MRNEIQRLQELAGILTEIKVHNPSPVKDGDRCVILTDVYHFSGDKGDYQDRDIYNEFSSSAVPKYELDELGYDNILELEPDAASLYIDKGEEGIYYDGAFESDEGSNTRIDPKYLRKI